MAGVRTSADDGLLLMGDFPAPIKVEAGSGDDARGETSGEISGMTYAPRSLDEVFTFATRGDVAGDCFGESLGDVLRGDSDCDPGARATRGDAPLLGEFDPRGEAVTRGEDANRGDDTDDRLSRGESMELIRFPECATRPAESWRLRRGELLPLSPSGCASNADRPTRGKSFARSLPVRRKSFDELRVGLSSCPANGLRGSISMPSGSLVKAWSELALMLDNELLLLLGQSEPAKKIS